MEMYQIRYFLAVCDTLNFTRAAEKCFVSQPSLTKAIQKLEVGLGGQLFDRTNSPIQLTELGALMQPRLLELYTSALQARDEAKRFLTTETVLLRVGIMCSICFGTLAPILKKFSDDNPNIEVRFDEGTLEQLSNDLDRGEIDIAIMASPYDIPDRFNETKLYSEDFVIACHDDHSFAGHSNLPLTALDGEAYASRENCEYAGYINDILAGLSVRLNVRNATVREDWIAVMVRHGMGVAFMPEATCRAAGLRFATLAESRLKRRIGAYILSETRKRSEVSAFLNVLTSQDWQNHGPLILAA